MTIRPGVNFLQATAAPPNSPPSNTGVAFIGGVSAFGPTDQAKPLRTIDEFEMLFGARSPAIGIGWDAVQVALNEGVALVYFGRFVGATPVQDTHTFNDGAAAGSIAVTARGAGASGISIQIVAGQAGSTVSLIVIRGGKTIQVSPDLALPADIAAWAANSPYISVLAVGTVRPAVIGATALTGGTADLGTLDDTARIAQLPTLFPYGLGPGQILIPGSTSDAIHEALHAHAQLNNRFALNDPVDTPTAATLITEAQTIQANESDDSYSALFTPWMIVPGVVQNTTRTVPPSCVAAGLMARRDAETGDPNKAAAGANGVCRYAIGVSQVYSDTDRQALNDASVNVFRQLGVAFAPAAPRLYGYRTMVNAQQAQGEWVSIGGARLRMAIQYAADLLGEEFMFDEIDGQGHTIAAFGAGLTAILLGYYTLGALFGATPAEAFRVDVGPTVNTLTTIQNNELRATISIRISKFAEMITFTLVAVPITQSLAA